MVHETPAHLSQDCGTRRESRAARVRLPVACTLLLVLVGSSLTCRRSEHKPKAKWMGSGVVVTGGNGDRLSVTTPTAEFRVLPSGYIQAALIANDSCRSLDEPPAVGSQTEAEVVVDGSAVRDLALDLNQAVISEPRWGMGPRGKHLEIYGRSKQVPELEKTLILEVYDDLPGVLFSAASYKNLRHSPMRLGQVTAQTHRLDVSHLDAKAAPTTSGHSRERVTRGDRIQL